MKWLTELASSYTSAYKMTPSTPSLVSAIIVMCVMVRNTSATAIVSDACETAMEAACGKEAHNIVSSPLHVCLIGGGDRPCCVRGHPCGYAGGMRQLLCCPLPPQTHTTATTTPLLTSQGLPSTQPQRMCEGDATALMLPTPSSNTHTTTTTTPLLTCKP